MKYSCKLKLRLKFQFQEIEEAEEFCAEAARAARDLTRAEAEIELLQQLLKEKEEQVGCNAVCSVLYEEDKILGYIGSMSF